MSQGEYRIVAHPILGPAAPRASVTFSYNGQPVSGYVGEPIAMALWAAGIKALRQDMRSGEGRGMYCGIGHCFECRVTVGGIPNVQSCLEPVQADLVVTGEEGAVR
jgi:sarcosine oxidase subunit alpha